MQAKQRPNWMQQFYKTPEKNSSHVEGALFTCQNLSFLKDLYTLSLSKNQKVDKIYLPMVEKHTEKSLTEL